MGALASVTWGGSCAGQWLAGGRAWTLASSSGVNTPSEAHLMLTAGLHWSAGGERRGVPSDQGWCLPPAWGSGHHLFHKLAASPFSSWCPLCALHSGEKVQPGETPNSPCVPTSPVLLGLCLPLVIFPLPPASWRVATRDPPNGPLQMSLPGGDLATRESPSRL